MIKKIGYFITFVLLINLQIFSQATWEKIKTPTDFNLLKVCYLDSLHCWVGGDSGVILFSSNQGDSWELQNSGVNNYISDIFFVNDTLGWALTFELEGFDIRSKILKTINGGENWEKINFRHLNMILTTVYFKDESNGWIGIKPSGIILSSDGGYNWNEADIDTGGGLPVHQIGFSNDTYGFAVGGHVDAVGVCWNSIDRGYTWIHHNIGPDLFLDYVFIDSVNVISLTAELEGFYPTALLKFNLLDNSWSYADTPEYVYITALDKRTDSEIWGVVGRNINSFFVSKDSGNNWNLISSNTDVQCIDLAFADSLHGIAVGDSGYILKYIPDSTVSVDDLENIIVSDFNLDQNYPNPFNPTTSIKFSIDKTQYVQIKVYDVLGNEIETLVDEEKPVGIYTIRFTMKDKSSGVYFYQLKSGESLSTKKMILLK